jgi:hypothetical protein
VGAESAAARWHPQGGTGEVTINRFRRPRQPWRTWSIGGPSVGVGEAECEACGPRQAHG